jgi:hypothetical protein
VTGGSAIVIQFFCRLEDSPAVNITAARRMQTSDGRPAAGRVLVVLAAVVVGLMTLFAPPASASPRPHSGNGVGVIAQPHGRRVGAHEPILAGQGRQRAPAYDQLVVGSGVGVDTTGGGVGGGGRVFTHFTDEAGASGITGSGPLQVGESANVGQLTFAKGSNSFLIGEGRIGVTDLGLDATSRELEQIGVFGARQEYGIQFSEEDAFNSGARVTGDLPSRNIYSIPGDCTITGACTVTRLR